MISASSNRADVHEVIINELSAFNHTVAAQTADIVAQLLFEAEKLRARKRMQTYKAEAIKQTSSKGHTVR